MFYRTEVIVKRLNIMLRVSKTMSIKGWRLNFNLSLSVWNVHLPLEYCHCVSYERIFVFRMSYS